MFIFYVADVATMLMTANLIGITFARSLHYQFYSWYAHQLPFLAMRTKYPVVVKIVLLVIEEYAWNVFPSTSLSFSHMTQRKERVRHNAKARQSSHKQRKVKKTKASHEEDGLNAPVDSNADILQHKSEEQKENDRREKLKQEVCMQLI